MTTSNDRRTANRPATGPARAVLTRTTRMSRRPRRRVVIGVSLLVVCLLAAGSIAAWRTHRRDRLRLDSALESLEHGERDEARRIAVLLHARQSLPYDLRGGPPYVLGRLVLEDPPSVGRRRTAAETYAPAVRYLREAHERGFPRGHRARGLEAYGTALLLAERFDDAIPILTEALATDREDARKLHRKLARAHLRAERGDADAALELLESYARHPDTTRPEREAARLDQSRLLLRQGRRQAVGGLLDRFPSDSPLRPEADVQRVRLLIADGDALLSSTQLGGDGGESSGESEAERPVSSELTNQARESYLAGAELARKLIAREASNPDVARAAAYLLGVCCDRLDDPRGAREWFGKVRAGFPGDTDFEDGLYAAAGYREAELLIDQGNAEEGLRRHREMMDRAVYRSVGHGLWLTTGQIRAGLSRRCESLSAAGRHAEAASLAESLGGLVGVAKSVEIRSEILMAWGRSLEDPVGTESNGTTRRELARAKYREAGHCLESLARLRFSDKSYTDLLWRAGDAYFRGHAFARAAELVEDYLSRESSARHPEAHLLIARCRLALGEPARALDHASRLSRRYSKHPSAPRAALIVSRAQWELGDVESSKANLRHLLFEAEVGVSPDSLEWRDALFLLGEVLFDEARRRYEQASVRPSSDSSRSTSRDTIETSGEGDEAEEIESILVDAVNRLNEALVRYPDAPRAPVATYLIASSHRHLSRLRLSRANSTVDDSAREALHDDVQEHLRTARQSYAVLIESLADESRSAAPAAVRQAMLRNCYFGYADTCFQLNEYEDAIHAYSIAGARYADRPEALEALVRVSLCHRRLDRPDLATESLDRARDVLRSIPDDADFLATTRYDRGQWSRILDEADEM